jgi:hypothetical protein
MYLVVTGGRYMTSEQRADSRFLSWVYDNSVDVFRWHEGRFQRMQVSYEQRPPSKVMHWTNTWADVSPANHKGHGTKDVWINSCECGAQIASTFFEPQPVPCEVCGRTISSRKMKPSCEE